MTHEPGRMIKCTSAGLSEQQRPLPLSPQVSRTTSLTSSNSLITERAMTLRKVNLMLPRAEVSNSARSVLEFEALQTYIRRVLLDPQSVPPSS
jgi:hypothetical protein